MIAADPLGSRSPLSWSGWLLRCIGLLILAGMMSQTDIGSVLDLISGLQIGWFLGAVFLTFPFFLVKSWRWRVILHVLGIDIPSSMAVQMYGAGLFAGQTTPGQLGEIVRAHFLWRRGHDGVLATSSVVIDRALDLLLLIGLALPGMVLVLGWGQVYPVFVFILGAAAAVFVIRQVRWLSSLRHRIQRWALVGRLLNHVDGLLVILARALHTPGTVWYLAGATVLALAINITRFYLLLLSLGLTLPVFSLIFGVSLANLAGLLPITVAGIGVRDAFLVLIFQSAGQPGEGAIAFSLLILLVAYGLNLIWGFPAWWLENK